MTAQTYVEEKVLNAMLDFRLIIWHVCSFFQSKGKNKPGSPQAIASLRVEVVQAKQMLALPREDFLLFLCKSCKQRSFPCTAPHLHSEGLEHGFLAGTEKEADLEIS